MSVLINMDMPKNCACCDVACRHYLDHVLDGLLAKICHTDSRLPDCPLVPVPPHGRLIDADALINALQELFDKRAREAEFSGNRGACVTWNDAIYHIISAPTIIQAEECET